LVKDDATVISRYGRVVVVWDHDSLDRLLTELLLERKSREADSTFEQTIISFQTHLLSMVQLCETPFDPQTGMSRAWRVWLSCFQQRMSYAEGLLKRSAQN
jgi:hypothetical protein